MHGDNINIFLLPAMVFYILVVFAILESLHEPFMPLKIHIYKSVVIHAFILPLQIYIYRAWICYTWLLASHHPEPLDYLEIWFFIKIERFIH